MNEQYGDMFDDYLDPEVLYVIPTNGYVRNDGACVMGAGIAKEAQFLQRWLPKILGDYILAWGNRPFLLPGNMVSLPTKHHWKEQADLDLIRVGLSRLHRLWVELGEPVLYLPRPGCGNGRLSWGLVRPLVESVFGDEDRVYVWSLEEEE